MSEITNATGNVLSVYLNRDYETALTSNLKLIADRLAENVDRKDFYAAAERVREEVAKHKPSGKALAVFADSSRVLFSRELRLNMPTSVHWGN